MWRIERKPEGENVLVMGIVNPDANPMSFREAIDLWRAGDASGTQFRLFTSLMLASIPFQAFRFETPPITSQTSGQPFQFAIVNAPGLDRTESGLPFREHFDGGSDSSPAYVVFRNLGGDAILIVPKPTGQQGVNHCHLGSFLRTADQQIGMELWRFVGDAMHDRINDVPVWLSTAGGGVPWLHVRLDDRPKYYSYKPFKAIQNLK